MQFNVQREGTVKNLAGIEAQRSVRRYSRKAPGTRYGVLIDWRGGSITSGKLPGRYGRSIRDGK
jgi:hypothetical protein